MSAPAAADASVSLERLERGTRIAFQALGWLLLLGFVVPHGLESGDTSRWRWFWQPAGAGPPLTALVHGLLPVALALAALLLSTGRPVWRRGRRVLLTWGLAQAWLAFSWNSLSRPSALFPFGTLGVDALTGGLGLLLLFTQAHERAGAQLCRLGGIYALGAALLFGQSVDLFDGDSEGPARLVLLVYVAWGALLLAVASGPGGRRVLGVMLVVCIALYAVCHFLLQLGWRTAMNDGSEFARIAGDPTLESARDVLLGLAQPALPAVAAFAWWAGWRAESRAGRLGLTAAFRA